MIEKNRVYTNLMTLVVIDGEEYPLLKTTEKMVHFIKDDEIRRVKIEKVTEIR